MRQLAVAVVLTLCFVFGILLRYAPFAGQIDRVQKRTLFVLYVLSCLLNAAVMYAVFCWRGISMDIIKMDLLFFGLVTMLQNVAVIRDKAMEQFSCTAWC